MRFNIENNLNKTENKKSEITQCLNLIYCY